MSKSGTVSTHSGHQNDNVVNNTLHIGSNMQFDNLNESISFHFYSQMVVMIRYDVFAIEHNLIKYLNGFEIIF